ncbi:MAG: hypothetical protein ACO1OF_02545 [Adhaeribacter sp.]
MKKLLLSIGFLLSLTYCSEPIKQPTDTSTNPFAIQLNEYTSKYAGGYTIELDNVPSSGVAEAYILNQDGTAKWLYIRETSGGAEVESKKTGVWSATESTIKVTFEGKTDPYIETTYQLKEGKFYDEFTGRYLKPKE